MIEDQELGMSTIAEVMTPNPVCLQVEETIEKALLTMRSKNIRHLPITKADGQLVGLVTQHDILANIHEARNLALPVAEVMDSTIVTVELSDDIRDAITKLRDRKIGCLPVMDKGEIVGILTSGDFLALTFLLLE
jgi:CBS domain-containing protein